MDIGQVKMLAGMYKVDTTLVSFPPPTFDSFPHFSVETYKQFWALVLIQGGGGGCGMVNFIHR